MTRGDTRAEDSNPPGEYYCPTCEKTYQIGDRCPLDNTRLVKLATPIDPFIGRELDGRYTIVEKLGQGGMGAVYRAQQHGLGREVAVKVVNASLVSEPDVIKRFLREAKLASRLAHPNAVGVVDFGQTEDGVFYLVMELVQGRTLDVVLKADKVMSPARVVRIAVQVCDALDGAHALSIVHRDLKPSNIILLSQGRDLVKVLDFGLAKSVAPDQTSTTMTNAGALLGTPAFMPPELALGEACDGRADLYSLGCVLYLLASGRLPFMSDSAHELIALHASEDKPPPLTAIPPGLAHVIEKLLEKNPANRFQTAAETREALEVALGTTVTPATGLPLVGSQTNPSLGPFPATSDQFAALRTPTPGKVTVPGKPRSETEMQRLVSDDTMAAVNDTMKHRPAGATPMPAKTRSRWVIPGLVAAMVGVGAGAFLIAQGLKGDDAPPPATPVTMPVTPPAPTPDPAPAAAPTPPAEQPAATPHPDPTPPPPPTATATAKHPPTPATHKQVKPPAEVKTTPPPTTQNVTPPPTPPKTGSGSAAPPKTGLPF